jgi:hypothetical protein
LIKYQESVLITSITCSKYFYTNTLILKELFLRESIVELKFFL